MHLLMYSNFVECVDMYYNQSFFQVIKHVDAYEKIMDLLLNNGHLIVAK